MKPTNSKPDGHNREPLHSSSVLRRFSSDALLQGQRQIVIEHAGREYRLRLTAQGKLILTA
jgi:hemin uptake protein HemP